MSRLSFALSTATPGLSPSPLPSAGVRSLGTTHAQTNPTPPASHVCPSSTPRLLFRISMASARGVPQAARRRPWALSHCSQDGNLINETRSNEQETERGRTMRTTQTTQLEPRLARGAAESTRTTNPGLGGLALAASPRLPVSPRSKSLSRLAPGLSRRYWTPGTSRPLLRRTSEADEPNGLGGPS